MDVALARILQQTDSTEYLCGPICASPDGRLASGANREIGIRCLQMLKGGATELYLDLAHTRCISVVDLAFLVQLNREATALGSCIKLLNVPGAIKQQMERARLHEIFEYFESPGIKHELIFHHGIAVDVPVIG